MGIAKESAQSKKPTREDSVRKIMVETFCSAVEASNALRKANNNARLAIVKLNSTPIKDTFDRRARLHRALDVVLTATNKG